MTLHISTPLVLIAVLILIVILPVIVLAAFQDGRRTLLKLLYLSRNLIGIDVGLRGVVLLLLYSALPAVGLLLPRAMDKRSPFNGTHSGSYSWSFRSWVSSSMSSIEA